MSDFQWYENSALLSICFIVFLSFLINTSGTSLGCENSLELTSTSTDVAVETDVPQLDQMTMCIWAKAVDNPAKGDRKSVVRERV